jgi:hypothetical protein
MTNADNLPIPTDLDAAKRALASATARERERAARTILAAMADTTPVSFGLFLAALPPEESAPVLAWMRRALDAATL